MKNDLIEAILPELKAESQNARDEYLVKHPAAVTYDFYKTVNGSNFVFRWSKDVNVTDPKWHFRGYEEKKNS